VDFDPKDKYYKPAGFGNPPSAHYEYIEKGRRPWKYRPAGPFVVRSDDLMPYPRTCAHRGFNTIAPENSLPAFGAAVDLGAEEIEFDLWETKDGEIVSIHDSSLERVSDGSGKVWDHTYSELLSFDFGIKHSARFKGLKIIKFEEILKKFTCRTIMNIHIKTRDQTSALSEGYLEKIISLIRRYDCEKYIYFMCGNDTVLKQLKRLAPDLKICVGAGGGAWEIVDRAIAIGAQKVQLFKDKFNQEMIDKAHANGIICNAFYADDEDTCRRYLDMGVDTILTNDYLAISQIVNDYKNQ
jgi:glycerophosphoryl diester phosphodiesterase